ncbi:GGDEF domain-containing protein, partial [Brevirhabdus sp.]|uniref:GGDEF domain-containing protein n=1 Tax=Brevirhabdus sp. TaxID=2004514 RepID=UPI00405A213B
LRDQDLIARYGGEEFLIILPNCSEANARAAAERLRRRIAEEAFMLPCGTTLHITLSIGMALSSGQADCADALVDCADRALYASKAEGRNLVTLGSFGTPLH